MDRAHIFDHMGLEVFWVWKKRGNNLAVLVGTTKNCQLIPSIFSNENRYNKATIVPLDTLKMAEIQPTKWHVQVLSSHTCQKLLQKALKIDLGDEQNFRLVFGAVLELIWTSFGVKLAPSGAQGGVK